PVHLRERPVDLERKARARDRQDAVVRVPDVLHAVVDAPSALGGLTVAVVDRKHAGAQLDVRRAFDRDRLHEIALDARRRPLDAEVPLVDASWTGRDLD